MATNFAGEFRLYESLFSLKESVVDDDHFEVGDEIEYINEYDTEVKIKVIDTDGKVLTTEETFKDNDGKENVVQQTSRITVDGSGKECIVRTNRNGKPGYLYPPAHGGQPEFDFLSEDKETRFKVIMIVDDEEYTYGTYESRDRANEIAMQVRDEREIETYVEEV